MSDLADYLDDLAMRMDTGAKLLHQQAMRWERAGIDDAERLFRHAKELRGAARMMRGWEKGIRGVPTPGDEALGGADIEDRVRIDE